MKRIVVLAALAAAAVASSGLGSEAQARGGRGHGFRVGFVAPLYPVSTGHCRWYRTPYGPVKRCVY